MTTQELERAREERVLTLRILTILGMRANKDTPDLPFPEAWDRAEFLAIRVLNAKRQQQA